MIPTYNCEKQIERVLAQFDDSIAPWIAGIFVIDNLSQDGTKTFALTALEKISKNSKYHESIIGFVENTENWNLGGTHKVGFSIARDFGVNYVCVIHGDDQANIEDFRQSIINSTYDQFDALLGSRFMVGSKLEGYGFIRLLGNRIFNGIFSQLSGVKTEDMGSGLNIYGPKVLKMSHMSFASDDLTFHCYLLLLIYSNNLNVKYLPISWREHDQVSNAKLLKQGIKILSLLLRYRLLGKRILKNQYGKFSNQDMYEYTIKFLQNHKS